MSVTALHLYEQLREAPDENARAKAIAEAFGVLEDRFPQIREMATQGHVRESELRLQKEIKEVEAKLLVEIRNVDARITELELKIEKEIHGVRLEIKGVEVNIANTRADLIRWVVAAGLLQSSLIIGVLLKVAHLI